jgi:hypothetical protein
VRLGSAAASRGALVCSVVAQMLRFCWAWTSTLGCTPQSTSASDSGLPMPLFSGVPHGSTCERRRTTHPERARCAAAAATRFVWACIRRRGRPNSSATPEWRSAAWRPAPLTAQSGSACCPELRKPWMSASREYFPMGKLLIRHSRNLQAGIHPALDARQKIAGMTEGAPAVGLRASARAELRVPRIVERRQDRGQPLWTLDFRPWATGVGRASQSPGAALDHQAAANDQRAADDQAE